MSFKIQQLLILITIVLSFRSNQAMALNNKQQCKSLLLGLMVYQSFGWLTSFEEIRPMSKITGGTPPLPINISDNGYLVEFSDYLFGFTYRGADLRGYAAFVKHGEVVANVQVSTENTIQVPYSCSYIDSVTNEEYMLVTSRIGTVKPDLRIVGRLVKTDGSMDPLKPQFEITDTTYDSEGGQYGQCLQVNDKIFIGHYLWDFNASRKWEAYMSVYDVASNSIDKKIKVNHQPINSQHGVKFAALRGDNAGKIILIYLDEVDGLFLQLLDDQANVLKSGKIVQNSVTPNFFEITGLDDGGFFIVYCDNNGQSAGTQGNGQFATRYDKNMNQVCHEQIHSTVNNLQSMVEHKNLVIITYVDHNVDRLRLWTKDLNILDCTEGTEQNVYDSVSTLVRPVIGKTGGAESKILSILTITGANKEMYISESYLDQFTVCPQHTCAACYDGDNECRTCKGSTTYLRNVRHRGLDDNCLCEDGFFDDPNEFDCQECDYKCQTCENSAENCLVCNTSPNRSTIAPCLCNSHYFDDGQTIVCNECDVICLECEGILSNCISCNSNTRQTPDCSCKTGYYDTGATDCSQCHHSCSACITDDVTCTICSDSNRQGQNCDCRSGYFNDGINPICQKCDISCKECSGTASSCTSCKDNTTRTGGNCACKTGLYETGNGGKCIDYCSSKCLTCSGEFDNCTSCATTRSNSAAPSCELCDEGFYESGAQPFTYCLKCKDGCKSCKNGIECLECVESENELLPPNCLNTSKGYTSVEQGDGTFIDIKCDPKCETCSNSSSNCLSCQGMNRESTCECAVGFHDFENTSTNCIACPSICSSCVNPQHCLTCKFENFELNPSTNQCECKMGYTNLGGICIEECGKDKYWRNGKCNQCFYYQIDICLEECPSHTSKSGFKCEDNEISSTVILIIIGVVLLGALLLYILIKKILLGKKFTEEREKLKNRNNINALQNVEYQQANSHNEQSIQQESPR